VYQNRNLMILLHYPSQPIYPSYQDTFIKLRGLISLVPRPILLEVVVL